MASGPKVLVVGAGHAGLAAIASIRARLPNARVTVFEPRATHLLKPRLHEALVEDFAIELPLAALLPASVEHVQAAVVEIDAPRAAVVVGGKRVAGDFVVVASGARTRAPRRPRKRPGSRASAMFSLDTLEDVHALRRHVAACVRTAAGKVSAGRRRELLSVLVAGGGYTGVEASAELALLMRRLAHQEGISPALVHVTLCEARDRIFAGVPDDELAQRVQDALARKAVDVRTGESVRFAGGVPEVAGRAFVAATVLLATGIEGVVGPGARFVARSARWRVDETLRVAGTEAILAIGDAAVVPEPAIATASASKALASKVAARAVTSVAANAQHAVQEGRHAALVIEALVSGKTPPPFRASTLGEFLTLGDGDVVGWIQVAGRRVHLGGLAAETARTAAFARYLAGLKLGARVR